MYSSVGGQPTTTMKFLKELDLSLSFLLPQQKHISSHNTKRQGWRGGGGRSEEENQKGIPNSQSCPECCTTNDLERESECVCVCYVVCVYEEKSDRSTPLVLSREKMTVVAMKILSELNLPLFPSPAILQQLSLSLLRRKKPKKEVQKRVTQKPWQRNEQGTTTNGTVMADQRAQQRRNSHGHSDNGTPVLHKVMKQKTIIASGRRYPFGWATHYFFSVVLTGRSFDELHTSYLVFLRQN